MSIKAPFKKNKTGQSVGAKKALLSPTDKGSIKNPKLRVRFDAVIAEGRQLNNAIGTKVDEIEDALRRLRKVRFKQEADGVRPAESQKLPKQPANSRPAAPVQVLASVPSISVRVPVRGQSPTILSSQAAAAPADTLTLTKTRPASPRGGLQANLQPLQADSMERNAERAERELPAAIANRELHAMLPKVGIQSLAIETDPPTIPALVDLEETPTEAKSDLLSAAEALLAAFKDVNKKLDQAASPAITSPSADRPDGTEG